MLTTRYRRHLRDYPNLQLLEKGPNVLLVGFAAALVMLGNCLPAIAAGLAIS